MVAQVSRAMGELGTCPSILETVPQAEGCCRCSRMLLLCHSQGGEGGGVPHSYHTLCEELLPTGTTRKKRGGKREFNKIESSKIFNCKGQTILSTRALAKVSSTHTQPQGEAGTHCWGPRSHRAPSSPRRWACRWACARAGTTSSLPSPQP